MQKIGILTFHYSNNYGGVLQALSLQKIIQSMGYNTEIIDFVPSTYNPTSIINNLGVSRIFRNKDIITKLKKIYIRKKYSNSITNKFNTFREKEMSLSKRVDEDSLKLILKNYDVIIVGSDQVWNPSQRNNPEYFLNFDTYFQGKKVSYAADSTVEEVSADSTEVLKKSLNDFSFISVRNEHSYNFVKDIINKEATIVSDPTLLYDFKNNINSQKNGNYILTYILGKEIKGTHREALEKIKRVYGDIPVYAIKIPTMNFELPDFADEVFYDLDPDQWLAMFRNAKFVYTDSFHGVLFSIKYQKPFLGYYTEKMRSTRFVDLGKRYNIENYIVEDVTEIEEKESIKIKPDFCAINDLVERHKHHSLEFLEKVLNEKNGKR